MLSNLHRWRRLVDASAVIHVGGEGELWGPPPGQWEAEAGAAFSTKVYTEPRATVVRGHRRASALVGVRALRGLCGDCKVMPPGVSPGTWRGRLPLARLAPAGCPSVRPLVVTNTPWRVITRNATAASIVALIVVRILSGSVRTFNWTRGGSGRTPRDVS